MPQEFMVYRAAPVTEYVYHQFCRTANERSGVARKFFRGGGVGTKMIVKMNKLAPFGH